MNAPTDSAASGLPRSPELAPPVASLLLIVDVQERLLAVQPRACEIVWNARRLLDGATVLGVRIAATEQYPQKLGMTAPQLAERLPSPAVEKLAFSAAACGELWAPLPGAGIDRVVLCGIETHVCVQQTALDLLAAGYRVLVAVDAVGARFDLDHATGLRRMEASGATLTTTESILFEWCERAGTPEFKQISSLAKETLK
ncbi:MAG: isochorismatase family protein [Pirellulales bacterium]|nr:isochorismatase family protein [Pirellulales bacterium]